MTQTFSMSIGRGVALDAMQLVDSRMLVCANSGGGKSHLLRLLIEQTAGKLPVIVLDPEGEFSTVRAKVNALLVGPGGDVPASQATAKLLARRLVELRTSAVIDLYDFKPGPRRQYVATFLEALLALPRKLWRPMLVIVDEAHKFAPEGGKGANDSRAAVISLMDQGRKRGIGGVLATQRLSKLAKDAAAEANNLLIGRFAQDVDLRRASDQLGFSGKSEWSTMRDFEAGEFFAVGPAFQHRGVKKIRTAKTKTTHPRSGTRHLLKPPAPTSAVKKVLKELGDLPAQAQEQEDELVRLRRTVRELQAAVTSPPQTGPSVAKLEADELRARLEQAKDRDRAFSVVAAGLAEKAKALLDGGGTLVHINAEITDLKGRLETLAGDLHSAADTSPAQTSRRSRRKTPPRAERAPAPVGAPPPSSSIGKGAPWKIVVALMSYGRPAPKSRIAILAGVSVRSSTFRNALTTLKNAGYIVKQGSDFAATTAAHAEFRGQYTPMGTSPEDLIPVWRAKLGDGVPGRVFDVLVAADGSPLDKSVVAERASTSPTSSTFRNALTKLNKLGLLTKSGTTLALTSDLL